MIKSSIVVDAINTHVVDNSNSSNISSPHHARALGQGAALASPTVSALGSTSSSSAMSDEAGSGDVVEVRLAGYGAPYRVVALPPYVPVPAWMAGSGVVAGGGAAAAGRES